MNTGSWMISKDVLLKWDEQYSFYEQYASQWVSRLPRIFQKPSHYADFFGKNIEEHDAMEYVYKELSERGSWDEKEIKALDALVEEIQIAKATISFFAHNILIEQNQKK